MRAGGYHIRNSAMEAALLPNRPSFFFSSSSHRPKFTSTKRSILELLDREWMLPNPASQIHKISLQFDPRRNNSSHQFAYSNDPCPKTLDRERDESKNPFFYVVRDDLLHPLVNGNKARKLDALLPILQRHSATDVVTCGGCQSAHAAALAVSCAERGIRSHLLLRGEQPKIPTGYNLISLMYGNVSYVARSVYTRREEMMSKFAGSLAGNAGCVISVDGILGSNLEDCNLNLDTALQQVEAKEGRRIVIVREGAGDAVALLGVIRLVRYLSQAHLLGTEQHVQLVVDAGTGTTAIGLALGAHCLGLPWKVTAVMLADTIESYKKKEKCLISDFKRIHHLEFPGPDVDDSIVHWVERIHPRRFGRVLTGEIEQSRQIAQQIGVLLDPIYTLAAWERAILSLSEAEDGRVVMLHTGGTLGLFGLAQRYASCFHSVEEATDCFME